VSETHLANGPRVLRALSPSQLHYVRCDLCDADDAVEVMRKHGGLYDHEFSVVRCRKCGLVYVNPRLDDATIVSLYDEEYYRGLGFDQTISYARDSKLALADVRRANADFVATLRGALGGTFEDRSIVDVGCGMGGLVRSLRADGADAIGLDSSSAATQACRENGTPLAQGDVDDLVAQGSKFDALTAMEVIEHTFSPRAFLESVIRLLKPNGVIYVTTGNWNLVRHLRGTPYVMPEGHIYYFTPVTMRRYFDLAGLETANVLNRAWAGWQVLGRSAGPNVVKPIADAFSTIAPGYGPFPIGVLKARG
jgi:2-polyprenyl-3-methyl-5-hydroxy-6-metoxy-1,4-benzoquinol methylase